MDTVSGIASLLQTTGSSYTANPLGGSELGMDDFLKLLVAQMQNQDPMGGDSSGGGGGTEYITQLAQFTMLEQLSALKSELSASKAYNLLGKYVYIEVQASSEQVCGKVEGIVTRDGKQCVVVGGQTYEMSRIIGVADDSSVTDQQLISSAAFIGKHVTATLTAENGTQTTINGIVEKITVDNGAVFLVIDGQNVPLSGVTEISETDAGNDTTQNA